MLSISVKYNNKCKISIKDEFILCVRYLSALFIHIFTTFLCCRNTICGRNNGRTKNERKKITPQMGWHLRIRHATPFKDKARAIYTLFIFRLRCQIKLKTGILITALKDTTHTVLNHPLNSWDRFLFSFFFFSFS